MKTSPIKNSIKQETVEEEGDMFADEFSRPSTSTNSSSTHFNSSSNDSSSKRLRNGLNNSVAKEENKPAEDDSGGFFFNSPPKKKKTKQLVDEKDEEDLFALPKAPTPTKSNGNESDEDESDFLSCSKVSKSMKASKSNLHEESKDMFETQDLPSTACSSVRGEKRKGRGDSESESPPFKKPSKACLDVTKVQSSLKHTATVTGFLNANDYSQIKRVMLLTITLHVNFTFVT